MVAPKVLALIGSLRKGSFNRSVFNFYKEMAAGSLELFEGTFHEFPLYNADIQDIGFPPSVQTLANQIKAADGLLIFSPEYNYSIPGVLKNALDWLSRLPEPPFKGKPCSILSASPGKLGGARMQYHLRQVAVTLDLKMMNAPEVMISGANKIINEGQIIDEGTKKFLKVHLDAFLKFVR
jgi:chromate reductase, NAD(P)H dehydrogenase (quinone)